MNISKIIQNIALICIVLMIYSCLKSEDHLPTPAIVSVTPAAASPGESVLLLGGNFSEEASKNNVTFGGATATVTASTENSLRVIVPEDGKDGHIVVTVEGVSSSSISEFDVLNELVISSVFPNEAKPLDVIAINGFYFDTDAIKNELSFNNIPAEVISATSTVLNAVVPQSAQIGAQEIVLKAHEQTATYSDFEVSTLPPFYFTKLADVDINNYLYKVSMASSETAFAVGTSGTLLSTQDGGQNWTQLSSGTSTTLRDVHAFDSNSLAICGSEGLFIKSTDGAKNWETVDTGTTERLRRLYFVNNSIGWMVGSGGLIFKTDDGGQSWNRQVSGTTFSLYGVYFINEQTGWVVGNDDTILKTTNGGTTWELIGVVTGEDLTSVVFKDEQTGWVTGDDNVLLATTDGGMSWTKQDIVLADDGDDLNDITIMGDVILIVADDHQMVRSDDNGATWIVLDRATDISSSILHIEGIDSFLGAAIAVGRNGIIIH